MTPERQNEIWAMLPHWFRKYLRDEYDDAQQIFNCARNDEDFYTYSGRLSVYTDLFGLHNLTAQAEEKPKEPKKGLIDKMYDLLDKCNTDTPFKNKPSHENSLDVTKSDMDAGHFDIVSFQYNLNYRQYRLDLAKEIAVAIINNPSSYGNIAMTAVDTANEIVKRLKETEE